MKIHPFRFIFILLLLPTLSIAQSLIEGNWTGVLHQDKTDRTPFTEYKFSMMLHENSGQVSGTSTLITGPNFGVLDLKGTFSNNSLTFQEDRLEKEKHTTNFSWCLKSGTLKLTNTGTQLKLEGEWTGFVMNGSVKSACSPGKITLIKEQGLFSIKGFVVDEKSLQPIPAFMKVINKGTRKEEATLTTTTGEYDIKLPKGSEYELTIESQDYLTRYQTIKSQNSAVINLPMKPIEVGQTVSLKTILFEKGTSVLTAESFPELERFGDLLVKNPSLQIELQGHTSNEGDPAKNMTLSEERVKEIKKYLVSKGVLGDQIRTRAFGAQKPIAPNDTEENRKKNRRVEFLILNI
jgi:outer membrane protein OmpA-like peptidoglycan-associated protein